MRFYHIPLPFHPNPSTYSLWTLRMSWAKLLISWTFLRMFSYLEQNSAFSKDPASFSKGYFLSHINICWVWRRVEWTTCLFFISFLKTYLLPFSKTSPLKKSSGYTLYSFFLLSSSFNFVVTVLFHWRVSTIFLFTTTTSVTILGNFIIHVAELLNTLAAHLDEFVLLLAETNLSTQHWILPPSTHAIDVLFLYSKCVHFLLDYSYQLLYFSY